MLFTRPSIEHTRALPDCEPDPWPVHRGLAEDLPSSIEAVARKEQPLDALPVAGPFLDLVKISLVGVERIVGLLG